MPMPPRTSITGSLASRSFENASPGMRAAFMRAPGGENHHDLGLFEVGAAAPRPPRGLRRPLPPRLGGGHHRGPRYCPAGHWERLGPCQAPGDHGVKKVPLRGATRTAMSSRSCGACPARRGASSRTRATVLPLDLETELARWRAGPRSKVKTSSRHERADAAQLLRSLFATAARMALTSNGVSPGCLDRISATSAVMCGAANELPVATVMPPSRQATGTSTPQAPNSTGGLGL